MGQSHTEHVCSEEPLPGGRTGQRKETELACARREQIVTAAVAIITEQGLDKLSLSRIEERAGMSRGQLTYYFPTREDILLAVFERLLLLMKKRAGGGWGGASAPLDASVSSGFPCADDLSGWDRLRHFLSVVLVTPPDMPGFHSLQYTFLAQLGHREDLRERLAGLYEQWRNHLAQDVAEELSRNPSIDRDAGVPDTPCRGTVSARTVASFIQAILHGLAVQRTADPEAYDRQEMLDLCLEVLGQYLKKR